MKVNSWICGKFRQVESMKRIRKIIWTIEGDNGRLFRSSGHLAKSVWPNFPHQSNKLPITKYVRSYIQVSFINETSTIDFRLISDNRIDTRQGEKKNDTSFTFARDFVASLEFISTACETKQPLKTLSFRLQLREFRFVINPSSSILLYSRAVQTRNFIVNDKFSSVYPKNYHG